MSVGGRNGGDDAGRVGTQGQQRWWQAALAVSIVAQLVVLYAPSAPGPPSGIPGFDKYVHAAIFAAAAFCARQVGFRARWVVAVLVGHAVLSELIQHFLLPGRSGDWQDVLADVGGVFLGVLLGAAVRSRRVGRV